MEKNTKTRSRKKADIETLNEQERKAELQFIKLEIAEKKSQIIDTEERTKIEKVNSLRWLLESLTIDEERTVLGSEPVFKSVFNEAQQIKIRQKAMKIVDNY